ncbi:ABC transporter ATP-binding protein [Clostridium tagluense]|uniref:ABC transporter ATP-binding protein n=1 Tax=Clostridium tagluense TaxID=360422 RepID=UPI001CF316CA|nr:ABC transporter ATP-binding protein [Clostridium tagluense]MCB2311099.1 ABC transporter ATP-binding protein [Clostridium tagluense]MCB2318376.1 ABC transporter ATP-binding protein [Clostridium tagluense]MCB2323150.1 ABC transporter ATP-binding protein [Clostridium tagluense]MCB2325575.1 ABC transporter ATP-binding protein [Clostridium tagluense]MCB2332879.1 ABC transporter ATP-binding protein [Clostridium tagluense]
MKIVKIEGLAKKFKDVIAVDNVSLSIEEGEIYGLLGPNGAGKSTIINILCGLLTMDKGKIEILGKGIESSSTYIKQNIGVVPQEIAIYEDLTAYENVKFFASLYGLKGSELKEKVEEALEFVGLLDKKKQYPKSFSGGMKRRLNIACSIAHRPKLIIMDEPTVGIDPQSRNHILQSVKKLNLLGCTIIYTTHYMEEVEAICGNIAIMDHGKVIAQGTVEELKSIVTDVNYVEITVEDVEVLNIEQLKAIPGVVQIEVQDEKIKIESKKDVTNLDKIILYFTNNNISIKNIESKNPDLESVFLTLTGRKLRD